MADRWAGAQVFDRYGRPSTERPPDRRAFTLGRRSHRNEERAVLADDEDGAAAFALLDQWVDRRPAGGWVKGEGEVSP